MDHARLSAGPPGREPSVGNRGLLLRLAPALDDNRGHLVGDGSGDEGRRFDPFPPVDGIWRQTEDAEAEVVLAVNEFVPRHS